MVTFSAGDLDHALLDRSQLGFTSEELRLRRESKKLLGCSSFGVYRKKTA